LWLCNAQCVKNVPGCTTDLSDAEYLAAVATDGMVLPSLIPPPPVRELREPNRYLKTHVGTRVRDSSPAKDVPRRHHQVNFSGAGSVEHLVAPLDRSIGRG
jgi:hypothetical protein